MVLGWGRKILNCNKQIESVKCFVDSWWPHFVVLSSFCKCNAVWGFDCRSRNAFAANLFGSRCV